jgi:hypothetical protein
LAIIKGERQKPIDEDNRMSSTQKAAPYELPGWTHAQRVRHIRRSGIWGTVAGALIGAFFGLITPITVGAAGFALIYLPPPSWFLAPVGLWIFPALGGIEGMIAGYPLGAFVGAVRRAPPHEKP